MRRQLRAHSSRPKGGSKKYRHRSLENHAASATETEESEVPGSRFHKRTREGKLKQKHSDRNQRQRYPPALRSPGKRPRNLHMSRAPNVAAIISDGDRETRVQHLVVKGERRVGMTAKSQLFSRVCPGLQ